MTDRPEPSDAQDPMHPPGSPAPTPDQSPPVGPSPDSHRRGDSLVRRAGLGVIGFIATLALLFGLLSFTGRAPAGSAPPGAASQTAVGSVPPGASATQPFVSSPSAGASPSGEASPSGDPVLVGAGDIAVCDSDADNATAALIDQIPGTVFAAGDNAYETGSAAEFRDCYATTWGRFLARTKPAAGNHDWLTKGAAGYLGYFGIAAAPNGATWYSYDLGTWHVIVLDSDCGKVGGCGLDSAQGRWLAADLAASTTRCTLAIWHHPRFSSGFHGNERDVAPFWQALYDAGADVVINGHDHDYERFAPQDPAGQEDRTRGLREFIVGTGGAALRDFRVIQPNSELRAAVSHGVLRLVLHKAAYEWTFIPTAGDFRDSGSGPCH